MLALAWGVVPLGSETELPKGAPGEDVEVALRAAVAAGTVQHGDVVVVVAAGPAAPPGGTDLVRVMTC
jgi:pyruvate kinase